MINKVIMIGRLTRDVELKMTSSGIPVCSFTVAIDNRMSKDAQERTTSFINCVAWQATAKLMATYLKKGSLVGVEGRLQSRSYETKDGRKATVTEVVCENIQFLDPKDSNNGSNRNAGFSMEEDRPSEDDDALSFSEEDLPF